MHKIYYLFIAIILVPFLQACPKTNPVIKEEYEVNKWIYSEMVKYYLWSEEMPSFDDSRPMTGTQEYFDVNIRYRKNKGVSLEQDYYGDRFSHIKYTGKDVLSQTRTETEQEFDFGFLFSRILNPDKSIAHLQVLYVNPNGPAAKAGLQRGDVFSKINGTRITKDNWESLLSSAQIKIDVLNRQTDEITISKGRYYDNPILLDTIYDGLETKTAYLVYNHFTSGDNKAAYAAKLKDVFGRYKSEGVRNLILDLRYNGGGEVTNAELLASLIAPANMLGKEFMRMQRKNSTDASNDADWNRFSKYNLENQDKNADIEKLYVITSANTASASELIIHTMRPIFRDAGRSVYVVGQTTYGKNLGSFTYTYSQYEWELSPIAMRVYNIDRKSGYEEGLRPDTGTQDNEYMRLGSDSYYTLPPLGDYEHENLLNIVFNRFYDIPRAPGAVTRSRSGDMLQPMPMVPQRGLSGGTVLVD